jgi:hypothetical protein
MGLRGLMSVPQSTHKASTGTDTNSFYVPSAEADNPVA